MALFGFQKSTPKPTVAPGPIARPTLPETVGMSAQASYLPLALQAAKRARKKAGEVRTTATKPALLGVTSGATTAPLQSRRLLGS